MVCSKAESFLLREGWAMPSWAAAAVTLRSLSQMATMARSWERVMSGGIVVFFGGAWVDFGGLRWAWGVF